MEDISLKNKILTTIKDGFIFLIVFAVCLAYALRGLFELEDGKKTWEQIVGDTAIALVMGVSLSILLGAQGAKSGRKNVKYIASESAFGEILDKVTPNIHHIDKYCDIKNEQRLINKKTSILRRHGLSYKALINGDYANSSTLSKKQLKAIRNAEKAKVFNYTTEFLVSCNSTSEEVNPKMMSLASFNARGKAFDIGVKIVTSIVFGYYGTKIIENPSWEAVLFSALQVSIWLVFATMSYLKNYDFVTETYRTNIVVNKTNKLWEFQNLFINNPLLFKEGVNQDGN